MFKDHIPCPGRIVSELGDRFSFGLVVGSIWYFIKGCYYSVPKERLKKGLFLLRLRAPILASSYCLRLGVIDMTSCTMRYIRKKEDQVNIIVGGMTYGFIFGIRNGFRVAFALAIFGGLIFGGAEVLFILERIRKKRNELIMINQKININKKKEKLRRLI